MREIPWIKGTFRHILDPPGMHLARQVKPNEQWYINGHCIFVDEANRLHWFGITNPYPEDSKYYGPGTHRHIGHASAKHPYGPWENHPHAFVFPEGSPHSVGACFVACHGDEYTMIYGSNVRGNGLHTARSTDLLTWEPIEDNELISVGHGTRDPCVVQVEDGRYLLYVTGGNEGVGKIFVASSADLLHWKWEEPALVTDQTVTPGALESPFVHFHAGCYYLFVNYSHRQYEETLVFANADPYHFDWQQPMCTLFAHAAEIFTWGGCTYITHCGIEDQHWRDTGAPYGLWLAELKWAKY